MAKKKPKGVDGVVEIKCESIRKTNRFFISLRSYGHCDENGRAVMSVEYSAKKIPAPPDRPLMFIAALLENWIPAMRYSSEEAMKKDLAEFQKYVAGLRVTEDA